MYRCRAVGWDSTCLQIQLLEGFADPVPNLDGRIFGVGTPRDRLPEDHSQGAWMQSPRVGVLELVKALQDEGTDVRLGLQCQVESALFEWSELPGPGPVTTTIGCLVFIGLFSP